MGGEYEEPGPDTPMDPIVEPGITPLEVIVPTVEEQSNQQMTNAWMAKVDAMWETMQNDVKREQEYNDSLKQIQLRIAQDGASFSAVVNAALATAMTRGNDMAAAMQGLVLASALGQQITANKLSAEVATADVIAKKAVDAATAAMTGTSAPSQGTTGVAQGGVQTVGAVAADAIMAQITKLGEVNTSILAALGVLTAKVAALEVQPAA